MNWKKNHFISIFSLQGCRHLRPVQVLQRRQGRVQEEVSPWQEGGRVSTMYKPVSKEIISNDVIVLSIHIFLPRKYINIFLPSWFSLPKWKYLFLFFTCLLSVSTNHDDRYISSNLHNSTSTFVFFVLSVPQISIVLTWMAELYG